MERENAGPSGQIREGAAVQAARAAVLTRSRLAHCAGIVAGMVLGAGVALLVAPQSGEHTRLALSRELRRRRPWRKSSWERLGEEFREAARFGRNRLRGSGTADTPENT